MTSKISSAGPSPNPWRAAGPRAAGCGARLTHQLASPEPSHPADEAFLRLARAM